DIDRVLQIIYGILNKDVLANFGKIEVAKINSLPDNMTVDQILQFMVEFELGNKQICPVLSPGFSRTLP
ncbi:MAG: hypothetical protein RLZZ143_186, partial [Cyanobacteriota bacterium]